MKKFKMKKFIIEYGYNSKEPSEFAEVMASDVESARSIFMRRFKTVVKNPYGPNPKAISDRPKIWCIKEKIEEKEHGETYYEEQEKINENKIKKQQILQQTYADKKALKHAKNEAWKLKHPDKEVKK